MKTARASFKPGLVILHITTLFTLSVAHPIYDLLAKADHSTFFLAHHAKAIDIWLLVAILSLLLPLGLAAVVWMTALLSHSLARWLYLFIIFILIIVLFVPAVDRFLPQSGELSIVIGLGLSATAVVLYSTFNLVRFFVSLISLGIVIAPIMFLTSAPIRAFISAPENQDYQILSSGNDLPNIVMIVLDELPVTSLMDKNRLIDRHRYPNFHRLAQSSTWFRNTAATHATTRLAVPAMLTGVLARPGKENLESEDSLFTMLASTHRIVAMEHATRMSQAVKDAEIVGPGLADRFIGQLGDLVLIYAHLVLPRRISSGLPAIDNQWGHFTDHDSAESELDTSWPYSGYWPQQLHKFLAQLEVNTFPPKFYFLHLLMPHQPFQYDPEGKKHNYELPSVKRFVTSENLLNSEQMTVVVHQAHLLKLGFTDRLLGHIFQRLDEFSLFDSSLIIITADHGISFYWDAAGDKEKIRKIQTDDVASVPLFIKLPQQRENHISDVPVQTHDILPTVASLLQLEIPWEMDGISALDVDSTRQRLAFLKEKLEIETVIDPTFQSLHRKLKLFGEGLDDLYNIGPYGELVEQPVDRFSIQESKHVLTVQQLDKFKNVNPESAILPGYVEGTITARANQSVGPDVSNTALVIAVNGIVRTTTRTWEEEGELKFISRLPSKSFIKGANDISVYGIITDKQGQITSLFSFAES